MHDPNGIANWSVTHVDWSERKWHPKSYEKKDVSEQLIKNITVSLTFFYMYYKDNINKRLIYFLIFIKKFLYLVLVH